MNRPPRALAAYCAGLIAALYLPIAVMVAFSFNRARRNVAWTGFTTAWYGEVLRQPAWAQSLATSLEVALCAAALSSLLGLLAAYAMARHRRFPGRSAYAALLNAPMMLPEIVLGVGLLAFFVAARVRLSFGTLVCAHVVFCLPYSAATIRARLLSLSPSGLEEAALDLGASEWEAFRRVTLPLALPAVLSGAALAFTVSFEDFVTSFFVAGVGAATLPMRVYSMMKFGVTPEVNALSTLLLALALAGILARAALARDRAP